MHELLPVFNTHLPHLIAATPLILSVSNSIRQKILQRDHGCMDASGTPHVGILEIAHEDHTKPCGSGADCFNCKTAEASGCSYVSPDNLSARCTLHHLSQHIGNEGHNGLTLAQNHWAIHAILERLAGYVVQNNSKN